MFNPEIQFKKQEKEKVEYNFSEMERYVEPIKNVVFQMKSEIESGVYRALLGDDIGGRIPTLILEKIIKEKSPREVDTFFVAGGHGMPGRENFINPYDDYYLYGSCFERTRDDEEWFRYEASTDEEKEKIKILKEYLFRSVDQYQHGRVLICSEYAHFGNTLIAFGKYLEQINADPFDIMSLGILDINTLKGRFPFSKIFSAGFVSPEGGEPQYTEKLREALGLKKRSTNEEYLPHAEEIRHEDEIQQKELEENRKKLNEDIDKLAKKIISEVWV